MSNDSDPLDEVGEALTLTVAYVEDAIDDLKAATQEAVRDERFGEVDANTERLKELRSFTDEVAGLLGRWRSTLVRPGAARAEDEAAETAEEGHGGKQYFGRVKRGTKTTEAAFREPILRLLVDAGGSMPVGDCLDALESVMGDRLTAVDREVLPSDQRTVRWRNTAQWSRNALADQGLIDRSVRGVWVITPAGRDWLERRS
ncbi:MAG: winged helix-turn-helix domain-containing protein [Acidimicrobiales bacterium]|nr:winged helix-turn-helix domain-containing protein [Acidimicrobiales bacterium]